MKSNWKSMPNLGKDTSEEDHGQGYFLKSKNFSSLASIAVPHFMGRFLAIIANVRLVQAKLLTIIFESWYIINRVIRALPGMKEKAQNS
jgi:hypothetical protein